MKSVFLNSAEKHFENLSQWAFQNLSSLEELNLELRAEDTAFIRFNNNQVRQTTSVEQSLLSIAYQAHQKTVSRTISLTHIPEVDQQKIQSALETLRSEAEQIAEDPYQVPMQNHGKSRDLHQGELLNDSEVVSTITKTGQGQDLTGIYSSGINIIANANSKGQFHWFQTESFTMDYSLFSGNKAVKGCYSGTHWKSEDFKASIEQSAEFLEIMKKESIQIQKGSYKVYLAPSAVAEILGLIQWSSLSFDSYKKGNNAFKKLADGEKQLSPLFSMKENFDIGLTPLFNDLGEVSKPQVSLITNGKLTQFLISSRSEKEYGIKSNQANSSESARSIEILPGKLKKSDILKELGTGLYLSNLHYLNWSDQPNARCTGMTRYACLWVENGKIVGPIKDMRFDVSLFDILGEKLKAITEFQEIEAETSTYYERSIGGKKLPGILIDGFEFTL